MKDAYLKDQGSFMTVSFMTPKAHKVLDKQSNLLQSKIYGSEQIKNIDLSNKPDTVRSIISFLMSHDLDFDLDSGLKI